MQLQSIDIFNTPFRTLMLKLLNKNTNQKTTSQQPSFNISYAVAIKVPQQNPTPGPGSHNLQLKKRTNKIRLEFKYNSFSATNRLPLAQRPVTALGPGSFEPKPLKSTKVRIGTSVRPPLTNPGCAPGPGKYEYKSKIVETQGIAIKGSSYDPIEKERRLVPGAGTYEQPLRDNSPKFLFPKSQRHDFTKEKRGLPGPIYDVELKNGGPAYRFG